MSTKRDPLLIWGVPPELKAEFHADCLRKNTTMKDAIINFMRKRVSGKKPKNPKQ